MLEVLNMTISAVSLIVLVIVLSEVRDLRREPLGPGAKRRIRRRHRAHDLLRLTNL